jgi:acyl carrier protein phosphodiesterase
MNFFGHAVVAQRHEATRGAVRAEFVLGAMLPDFASMLRVRPPGSTLAELEAGVRFHHVTDDAFHGCNSFLEFSGHALVYLSDHGLPRGPARAVAHVGVELLLDSAFVSESANEAYLRAVASGSLERVASQIHWQSADSNQRFAQLCHTLSRRGPLRSDTSPELIAERLRNILASRPRLALDDAGQSVVRDWAMSATSAILAGAPLLLREVEQRLETAIGLER